jgi:hypothetical protein
MCCRYPRPVAACDQPSAAPSPGGHEPWERPVDRFRRVAVGRVVAAGLLGLRDALEGRPERDEVAIVSVAPGPGRSSRLDIQLDPDHPESSLVVIRPPATSGDGAA